MRGLPRPPARRSCHVAGRGGVAWPPRLLCLDEPGLLEGLLASAQRDGLTHCLNYTAIRHELDREIHRAERHQLSLSCCFLDLDDFKLVNERHGHLYGSHLLAEVATAIGSAIRSEDTLGRYGGDEFVAIFPETDDAAATGLAERVRSPQPAGSRRRSGSPSGAPESRPRISSMPPIKR